MGQTSVLQGFYNYLVGKVDQGGIIADIGDLGTRFQVVAALGNDRGVAFQGQDENRGPGERLMAGQAGGGTGEFLEIFFAGIQHGFDLHVVMKDPDWVGFSQHARLRPTLRKIIVLYGDETLLKWVGDRP